MLKLRFEIAFASLQAHPPEQSFNPVCCPLPPVCQPQPRMKRFAGKHILVPSLLWAGQGLRGGEAAESSRTRSAFPRFLPASAAESSPAFPRPPAISTPAFCAPPGLEEAYPEGRSQSWDFAAGRSSLLLPGCLGEFNHSLREGGCLPPSGAARAPSFCFTFLKKFSSDSGASKAERHWAASSSPVKTGFWCLSIQACDVRDTQRVLKV